MTEMNHREEFLQYFFTAISKCRYALIKNFYPDIFRLPESADIDLITSKEDAAEIEKIIRKGKNISQVKADKKSFAGFISIYFNDLSYLEIDLLHRFDRKGIIYMDADAVLDEAEITEQGIRVAAPHHQFEYVILFYLLNKSPIPEKYCKYFSSFNAEKRGHIFGYMTQKYNVHINILDELYEYHTRHRKKLMKRIFKSQENRGLKRLYYRLQYAGDVIHSFFSKRGITVTFSGVDGAGKSTVLENVKLELENKYRTRVKVLRHRPSLLPILSSVKYGKKNAEMQASQKLPRQGTNHNTLSSLFRFMYYYSDYLAGRAYVYFKYTGRGITVLYDRYYFDFIIDGRRSNISLHPSVVRFGYHLVSKPEVNIFLHAPEDEILSRKQELSKEDIRTMTHNYLELFRDFSGRYKKQRYISINNTNLGETMQTVMKHIISTT